MWGILKWRSSTTEKLPCPESADSCCQLPHRNQVASESIHGAGSSKAEWVSCNVCVEESKVCNCDHSSDEALKGLADCPDVERSTAKANSTFFHAVVNMVGMLIGLGQLSTPYALENGGWASTFLLVGLGVVCAYSAHLLGKCLDKNPNSRNFADIGHHAFGNKGRIIAATFVYLEIFMALVSYTISLHDNLITVFAGTHIKVPWIKLSTSELLTTMAVLVALPSLWLRDLSSISFLSSGGILMSLVIFTTVACTAIFGDLKANQKIPVFRFDKIPAISGIYVFSYAGHIVFPNLYKAMKDPSKFTKVSIVSFALVTSLYTSLAFMGAKMFGPQVKSQITLNMPPGLIFTKIALWATVLTPMTKYALEFAPLAMQLEHSLSHSLSSKKMLITRGSIGSLILLFILALALSVPYFEYVLSLTGSLVSIAICIILPCTFYLKICWGKIRRPVLILNIALIALSAMLAVSGTISSSKSLIEQLQRAHSIRKKDE